jgi:hypothetical protein
VGEGASPWSDRRGRRCGRFDRRRETAGGPDRPPRRRPGGSGAYESSSDRGR